MPILKYLSIAFIPLLSMAHDITPDFTQAINKSSLDLFFFRQAQGLMTLKGISIPQTTQTRLDCFTPAHLVFNSAQEAKDLTNAWVETETEGKIKNLVESLPEDTVLMLATAALYQEQ